MDIPSLKDHALEICKRYPEVSLFEGEFYPVVDDSTASSGQNMMTLSLPDGDGGYLRLRYSVDSLAIREDVYLPAHLCEPIFQKVLETRPMNYMIIFRDKNRCQLTKLDLSNKKIRTWQDYVTALFCHNLQEIDFSNSFLKEETVVKLEVLANSLKTLIMSQTIGTWKSKCATFLVKLEKLEKLDMSFVGNGMSQCLKSISKLKNLAWLDLSGCDLCTLVPLKSLASSLQHLYLYNVCQELESQDELAEVIPALKKLTHLDVSQDLIDGREIQSFLDEEILRRIGSLPALKYLDISGSTEVSLRDLKGLKEGLNRRIDFLGLFFINIDNYEDLPAEKITNVNDEEQLLTALSVYVKRSQYMREALTSLYNLVSDAAIEQPERALKLVLAASKAHLMDEPVQRSAGICIATILNMPPAEHLPKELRKATITTLLDVIECHNNTDVLRICIQCLCCFDIPDELGFVAYRLCGQLLVLMKGYKSFHLILQCLLLFNAIICHTADLKLMAGELDAVKIILNIIDDKVKHSQVDRVLETAWCALWNITDESDENCKAFIDNKGLELFMACLENFKDETDLQRSLLGLMGNIAEVQSLRCHLMKKEFVRQFMDLLCDGYDLEVRYNAAGILSHICSDGESSWTSNYVSRNVCMEKVIASIASWNIGASRNINYRSLKPILRLVPCFDTPCAQEWAVWALANLTKVYPDKYCQLLVDEGGVQLLQEIINSTRCSKNLKDYATMILKKIELTCGNVVPMEMDESNS